jgi:hypothetical protein
MTQDEEVRRLELATQLVLGPLANEWLGAITHVGELLAAMTERDREQIRKGERWGRRQSLRLTVPEARKVLRGLSIDQLDAFAERWGYCLHEVIEWSLEQRDIHGGALVALGDREEMAKITGETR